MAEQTASGTILVSPPKSDAPAKRNSPPLTPWAKIAHYKAELLRLEYERQQDLWLSKERVEREAFALGRERSETGSWRSQTAWPMNSWPVPVLKTWLSGCGRRSKRSWNC